MSGTDGAERRALLPRRLRHLAEYALARGLCELFGALPLDWASALGGGLGRALGPRLAISNRARANLARAFPDRGAAEREAIVAGMWAHLGRVLAEYPHLARIADPGGGRVEIVGGEHIAALRDDGAGAVCIGGHIGNWEILPLVAAREGLPLVNVYRAPNNPLVARLLRRLRGGGVFHPKGPEASRAAVAALRRGGHIGVLVDQKLNEGVLAPFFGRDAMTATTPARLAARFGVPLACFRVERLGDARFRYTVHPPLELPRDGDGGVDAAAAAREMNAIFEGWIRERPEQWLWLHRRWPEDGEATARPPEDRAWAPPRAPDRGGRRTN